VTAVGKIETKDAIVGIEDGRVGIEIGRRAGERWRNIVSFAIEGTLHSTHAVHSHPTLQG